MSGGARRRDRAFDRLLGGAFAALERGLVPTPLVRAGIRAVCARRLRDEAAGGVEAEAARRAALMEVLATAPIATATPAANRQHYEVPTSFYQLVLGPRRKYSSAYWPPGVDDLGAAEEAMLELTARRARLGPDQDILDLGCGWGALTLWAAARWPTSRITALSSSRTQRAFIEATARARGLTNITIVTGDVSEVAPTGTFDRVVSVEMFEHLRNHAAVLARVASWMRPDASLFVHVFAHRRFTYLYEDQGPSDWMAREFFTGGIMPSIELLPGFQDHVRVRERWVLDGRHYARTARAWYDNLMARQDEVRACLAVDLGAAAAGRQLHRWRVFFLACEELFGYRDGQEWVVAHYRFDRRDADRRPDPR